MFRLGLKLGLRFYVRMFFFAPSELMPEFIVGTFSKFSSASNFLGTFGNLTFLVKSGSTKPEPVSGKKKSGAATF